MKIKVEDQAESNNYTSWVA